MAVLRHSSTRRAAPAIDCALPPASLSAVYISYTLPGREIGALRIEALEIDDRVLDKIESRHGVPFHEPEEACQSPHRHVRRGREGLFKVFSQTEAGRHRAGDDRPGAAPLPTHKGALG